jgi:hypothetical protein
MGKFDYCLCFHFEEVEENSWYERTSWFFITLWISRQFQLCNSLSTIWVWKLTVSPISWILHFWRLLHRIKKVAYAIKIVILSPEIFNAHQNHKILLWNLRLINLRKVEVINQFYFYYFFRFKLGLTVLEVWHLCWSALLLKKGDVYSVSIYL